MGKHIEYANQDDGDIILLQAVADGIAKAVDTVVAVWSAVFRWDEYRAAKHSYKRAK